MQFQILARLTEKGEKGQAPILIQLLLTSPLPLTYAFFSASASFGVILIYN